MCPLDICCTLGVYYVLVTPCVAADGAWYMVRLLSEQDIVCVLLLSLWPFSKNLVMLVTLPDVLGIFLESSFTLEFAIVVLGVLLNYGEDDISLFSYSSALSLCSTS